MSDYKQCDQCGDDSEKYIKFFLYDCSSCGKKNLCESCIEWTYRADDTTYSQLKETCCSECYEKKEYIRKCNNCCRVLQCNFSTCGTCHKPNICIHCVQYLKDGEEMRTLCFSCYGKEYADKMYDDKVY